MPNQLTLSSALYTKFKKMHTYPKALTTTQNKLDFILLHAWQTEHKRLFILITAINITTTQKCFENRFLVIDLFRLI